MIAVPTVPFPLMCGRATITDTGDILPDQFSFTERANSYTLFRPRYNLSPRQEMLVVHVDPDTGATTLRPMYWNLIPGHLRTPEEVERFDREYSTFNARLERASSAPTFRRAWQRQRCLVIVDGIIEWTGPKGARVPYRIRRPDGKPFAMAGLWERWRGGEGDEPRDLWSCSVIVGPASEWFAQYHHRMARILPPELHARWLDPELTSSAEVQALLETHPYPMETMVAERISTRVNNPGYDGADALVPV
ncbi:MAG TPA: SOS response-associated peptidase [Gemmatimonadaceae bacterium]|nr:SOS response-associated peptidase [Gemmatimonadaceae bacterium]